MSLCDFSEAFVRKMVNTYYLSEGTLRFGELQRKMQGITQATLTKQLRMLEEYGLINRHVYPEVPPKVEYSLTDIGKKFIPVLNQFKIWGEKYIKAMKNKSVSVSDRKYNILFLWRKL